MCVWSLKFPKGPNLLTLSARISHFLQTQRRKANQPTGMYMPIYFFNDPIEELILSLFSEGQDGREKFEGRRDGASLRDILILFHFEHLDVQG